MSIAALQPATAQSPLQVAQQAYLKASNTGAGGDTFGNAVAVSGNTVVVGAPQEDSNALGVSGDQANNDASDSGAAYVFVFDGVDWSQQAYLKAFNTGANDRFGHSVAINGDTIVIGAPQEDSNATSANGDGANNGAGDSGAAYVFVREGAEWSQQAYLKASNTGAGDNFGWAVAVSGETLVIGAHQEASNAKGINGDQANNSASAAGAAYVFARQGTEWTQQAYLKGSNTSAEDWFGASAAISGDTVIVGALGNSGAGQYAGVAYVFVRDGVHWTQQATLRASNAEAEDFFGASVAVSGATAVVGAYSEDSDATGVNGDPANNDAYDSGAAYVFTRSGATWSQQAYLKASNTDQRDEFGASVAISGDTIVVSAPYEASSARGVNGDEANDNMVFAGAAYVFTRSGTTWSQLAYLKASNTGTSDAFGGYDGALSRGIAIDGNTLVVGAPNEASNATGVNGIQRNNTAVMAGAAYLFAIAPAPPSELRLVAVHVEDAMQITMSGEANTTWRLESHNAVDESVTWNVVTNFTLGPAPLVLRLPIEGVHRFYRAVWQP